MSFLGSMATVASSGTNTPSFRSGTRVAVGKTALRATPSALRRAVTITEVRCSSQTDTKGEINTMQPLGNRLLIKPEEASPVSKGGVILPTDVSMEENSKVGIVVALGDDVDLDLVPGQYVIFDSKRQVTEVPAGDNTVLFVAQPSIEAVLS
mmetsp:Transcript_37103/g.88203  ORF Transcript_37103/g.88203 Transcript_37103/m.88203 type:complete len:152 (-) Transcript_37103:57-512(-)